MTIRQCVTAFVLVLSSTAAVSVPVVSAQTTSAQPADPADDTSTARSLSTLDVLVDLFGAVDDAFGSSVAAPTTPETGPALIAGGRRTYWGGNSSLAYEKATARTSFSANLGASVRRFTAISDSLQPGYTANFTAAGRAGRRVRWDVNQSLSWGPSNATAFFAPGDSSGAMGNQTLPIVDYSLANRNQFVTGSQGTLSYSVSRRGSLSATANYQRSGAISTIDTPVAVDPPLDGDAPEPPLGASIGGSFQRVDLGGRYSHATTRYLTWYAGYGTSLNSASAVDYPLVHQIDVGFAYGRPLSFSRRTRISTQLGSSILQQRSGGRREWRATGNLSVRHELGRTWLAQVGYQRDTRFVPTFIDPILNDGVTASVGGSLSRRSSLGLMTNYSLGTVGISTGTNGYRMTSASANYRYAFLSRVAAYVEYFLFDFKFENGVPLGDSVLDSSKRHGIRFGLSFGTGLMGTRRRLPLTVGGENAQ